MGCILVKSIAIHLNDKYKLFKVYCKLNYVQILCANFDKMINF